MGELRTAHDLRWHEANFGGIGGLAADLTRP